MFLDNKYTKVYYQIIDRALTRPYKKVKNDGYQKHHIIPKSIGGADSADNLIILNYKEHRVCHCLLIKMQLTKSAEIKMRHAYGFFNKSSRYNGPRYKQGKDNIFSTPEIVEQVRRRMIENNPMKQPEHRERMSLNNNNPNFRPIVVEGITFPTIGAASRHFNISPYLLKKRYNYCLLDR